MERENAAAGVTETPDEAYHNGYRNLIGCVEDYASQAFADEIARPGGPVAFDPRMTLTELASCFHDMDFVLEDRGPAALGLSDVCVERLKAFRDAIDAIVDDGSRHPQALYEAYWSAVFGGTQRPSIPRGPLWKPDAEIVATPQWQRIQTEARALLALLPKPS